MERLRRLANAERGEEAAFPSLAVEIVDRRIHALEPSRRGARLAERRKNVRLERRLQVLEHGRDHVILPVGEVVVEARPAESSGLGDLGERSTVVSLTADHRHHAGNDFFS